MKTNHHIIQLSNLTLLSHILNNNRYPALFTSLLACIVLTGCSTPDTQLKKLGQKIYEQKTWEEPLPPSKFSTDGCSLWPDSVWVECCVSHDTVYWIGGTSEERIQADRELSQCVSSTGHPVIGSIMYYGVRVGGIYWMPTPYRWGFGWDYPQSGPPGEQY
jgi:hypothetical protein